MRVLCTGDIHIGRRASRLPDHQRGEAFSAAAAWGAVVDLALREQVDVVAISGDVVDRQNRFFEAVGPLEQGLRRLAEAHIDVVAVSGNHDYDVLPLLARGVTAGQLTHLGQAGTWQRHTIRRGDVPRLHIDGWSFPSERVLHDPLQSYQPAPDDGIPVLGLLHADLDQSGSRYAPVSLAALRQTGVAAWLLGHIHHPRLIEAVGQPLILYPGSPLAMDPGETGPHGPWMLEIRPGQPVVARQMRTSPIRYETLDVPLDDVATREDLLDHVQGEVSRQLAGIADESSGLRYVSFRLRLTGRTALHGIVDDALKDAQSDLAIERLGVVGGVERIENLTRPAIDLDELVGRKDPTGELARVLVALEAEPAPAAYANLLDDALTRLNQIRQHRVFSGIAADQPPDHADAQRLLLHEGYRLLDTLLAQRERGPT